MSKATIKARLQLATMTAAEWAAANPVLLEGEPGVESDTRKVKYGDGQRRWSQLEYATSGTSSGSGAGVDFTVDETLELNAGVLSVNTTDTASPSSTLPITSAAVYSILGDIETLLENL